MTAPDWKDAPEWAEWCTTDALARGEWWNVEPVPGPATLWMFPGPRAWHRSELVKGNTWPGSDELDWRKSKRMRPE